MTKPKSPIWGPAPWDEIDVAALQGIALGTANDVQQKRALDWIITKAALTYDEQFYPDNPRVTDFLLGRRSVGLQVVKLLKVKLGKLQKEQNG